MKVQLMVRFMALIGAVMLAIPINAQTISNSEDISKTTVLAQARVPAAPSPILSEEQRDKLGLLRDQFTLDTATKKAELKVNKRRLFNLMSKATIDKQEVLSLNSKISSLKAELADARIKFLLAASDLLTPEQRQQMRKRIFKSCFREGCGQGKHWGGFDRFKTGMMGGCG